MIGKLVCGGLGALALLAAATAPAAAGEAALLADRAGFLVGHAYRCGVAEARLQRSTAALSQLIAAYASDDDDGAAAQQRFGERLLAAALAEPLGDPLPACAVVRQKLAEFDRHRARVAAAGRQSEEQMVSSNRAPDAVTRRAEGLAKKPVAARPATTKREDLTPERRAALEARRMARQTRGKPPSI
ncbi:MAG: hypothetical protein ACM3JG_17390 [Thiohalocapsa sp.]